MAWAAVAAVATVVAILVIAYRLLGSPSSGASHGRGAKGKVLPSELKILRMLISKVAYGDERHPYGGWYDRRDVTHPFKKVMDLLLLAAMRPPGGGATFITPRLTASCRRFASNTLARSPRCCLRSETDYPPAGTGSERR